MAGEWTSGLLSSSEALSLVLDNVSVTQTFPSGENSLGQALKQVARVIKAREALGAERDVFLVEQVHTYMRTYVHMYMHAGVHG